MHLIQGGAYALSVDKGKTWPNPSNLNGPDGNFAPIWVSSLNNKNIVVAGKSSKNIPAVCSQDGGKTFTACANGLPNVEIIDLVGTPDEKWVFASTLAGPFVMDRETLQWADLTLVSDIPPFEGMSAEWLEKTNTVRFSTWGSGVWDYKLDGGTSQQVISSSEMSSSSIETISSSLEESSVTLAITTDVRDNGFQFSFNPSANTIFINNQSNTPIESAQLVNINGKLIQNWLQPQGHLLIVHPIQGHYVIHIQTSSNKRYSYPITFP